MTAKHYAWVLFDRVRDEWNPPGDALGSDQQVIVHEGETDRFFEVEQLWIFDQADAESLVCHRIIVEQEDQIEEPVMARAFGTTLSFDDFMRKHVVVEVSSPDYPVWPTLFHEVIEERWPPIGIPNDVDLPILVPMTKIRIQMSGVCRAIVLTGIAR